MTKYDRTGTDNASALVIELDKNLKIYGRKPKAGTAIENRLQIMSNRDDQPNFRLFFNRFAKKGHPWRTIFARYG
jgi:hypothetical protein